MGEQLAEILRNLMGLPNVHVNVNVNVEFKVTLHEQRQKQTETCRHLKVIS